jgi:hypothetical protein
VDARVWLKREDLQTVRSYKVRGAYNIIVQLDEETRGRGVVCASAGNHAQGVAYACRRLGANGRVFVPGTTPRQKRERITTLGGSRIEVIVVGETYGLQTAFGGRRRAARQHECAGRGSVSSTRWRVRLSSAASISSRAASSESATMMVEGRLSAAIPSKISCRSSAGTMTRMVSLRCSCSASRCRRSARDRRSSIDGWLDH